MQNHPLPSVLKPGLLTNLVCLFCLFFPYTLRAQSWTLLGPTEATIPLIDSGKHSPHGVGRLHSLKLLDRKGKRIVVGSSTGGTFLTEDGGKTWQPNYHYTYMSGANRIISFSRRHYWIATCSNHLPKEHWGVGVLKTTNRGKTWQSTPLTTEPSEYNLTCFYDLKRVPKSRKGLWALTDQTLWYSKDRGRSWSVLLDMPEGRFRNIVPSKRNPKHFFVTGKQTWVTQDGGKTFRDITENIASLFTNETIARVNLVFLGAKESYIMGMVAAKQNYLIRSQDGGHTWELMRRNPGLFTEHELAMESWVHKGKAYLLLGGIRAYMSADTGQTTYQVTFPNLTPNYVHDDIRDIEITRRGHIYLAHDGGISMSKDLGKTWQDLSGKGLAITQFYGMSNSEQEPYLIYAGTQDMSSKIYRNGLWYCTSKVYADGGRARMHPSDTGDVVISKSGYAYRFDSQKQQWRYAHPFTQRGDFDFPMEFSADGTRFFMVTNHIWTIHSDTQTWYSLTEGLPSNKDIGAFALSPHNPDHIWFSRKDPTWSGSKLEEKLYKTSDGGRHWEDLTLGLPALSWKSVRCIHIQNNDSGSVWLGLGSFDPKDASPGNRIFVSHDTGISWQNVSAGLPNFPVNAITSYGNTLFAATDVGVYQYHPSRQTWEVYGTGLPPVVTREIHVNYTAQKLRAATFGRGIWEVDLPH